MQLADFVLGLLENGVNRLLRSDPLGFGRRVEEEVLRELVVGSMASSFLRSSVFLRVKGYTSSASLSPWSGQNPPRISPPLTLSKPFRGHRGPPRSAR